MESARLYPEWLTNLFWIGLVVTLFTIGYFGYQGFMFQESRKAAYQKGQDHIIAHFTEYFDDDPKAYEAYTKWKEEASSVPSGK